MSSCSTPPTAAGSLRATSGRSPCRSTSPSNSSAPTRTSWNSARPTADRRHTARQRSTPDPLPCKLQEIIIDASHLPVDNPKTFSRELCTLQMARVRLSRLQTAKFFATLTEKQASHRTDGDVQKPCQSGMAAVRWPRAAERWPLYRPQEVLTCGHGWP